jgi:tRNA A37 threonylcarbamoyladenosine dehydratase
MMSDVKRLAALVAHVIDQRRDEIKISPAWVATGVLKKLDPDRITQEDIYLACHLQLRQIARQELRKRFDGDERYDEDEDILRQHEMFPELQWRYPSVRSKDDAEPQYVLLEQMSEADVFYNVARLRSEGAAKLHHADALETWWERAGQVA